MSKSLNLYIASVAGIGLTMVAAINLAGGNVADVPVDPPMMAALAPSASAEVEVPEASLPIDDAPEAETAEAVEPVTEAPEAETAEAAEPVIEAPEAETAEAAEPVAEAAEVETAEAAEPMAEAPEAETAEAAEPMSDAADAETAEAAEPMANAAEMETAEAAVALPEAQDGTQDTAEVTPAAAEGAQTEGFGLGRPALPEEIAAWNVDIQPDGTGLPEGSGTALEGEGLFEDYCAACHGSFAEGVGNWPKLAGGDGTLANEDPVKTVGSYWPYTSTVWDYVHRSMPFGGAQSLTDDEVYAIVAYILYSNFIIDDDFELTQETLATIEMPNADGFIVDDRAETEYPIWRTEPCMENCKDSVEITMRATVLDVTPEEESAAAEMDHSDTVAQPAPSEDAEPVVTADAGGDATTEPVAEAAEPAVVETAALDADLVEAGERVFNKCKACHQIGEGATNRSGPQLNGVVGREIGGLADFRYSGSMADMGGVWTEETLAAFLADPRGYVQGTKMAFAGLRKDEEIAAITEFLKSHSQ